MKHATINNRHHKKNKSLESYSLIKVHSENGRRYYNLMVLCMGVNYDENGKIIFVVTTMIVSISSIPPFWFHFVLIEKMRAVYACASQV